jgi:hypothetical protein
MTKLFYTLRLMGHPMRTPFSLVRYATSPHDAENRQVSSPRACPFGTPVVYQAHQRQHPSGLLAGYSRLRSFCRLTAWGQSRDITRTHVVACLLLHLQAHLGELSRCAREA